MLMCTMQPKISVVMPIYNAKQTLGRMIDSIISQTFTDWELLCIDDGSTDGSADILDEYASKEERIIVVHKENEGVAMARQLGIELAKGEYSIHVDSDDWVDSDMLMDFYTQARKDNADIVIADYYRVDKNKQLYVKQNVDILSPNVVLKGILSGILFGALWNKLIRTSLYKDYGPKFFKGIDYCEDVLICSQLLKHDKLNIAYLPKAYYYYVINQSSITHTVTRKTYEIRQQYIEKLLQILSESQYISYIQHAKFSVFHEAFTNDVLTKEEIKLLYNENKDMVRKVSSIRWRVGFCCLRLHMYSLARKLLAF